ncbi:hypothetical protein E2I00_006301, partial [Balaenoptera physalus]
HPERLHLDFGSAVPLRTRVNRQLILTNCSPIQTPFTLNPDMPPALLKMARMRELLAKREQLAVIPVHMVVVGCPISSHRTARYTTDQIQKEPVVRFGTRVSGGDTVTRILRLRASHGSETYAPEDREDRLLELLVFYGPPSPPRDQAGSDRLRPEAPESSSSFWSPSPSDVSKSSREAAQPVSRATPGPQAEGGSSASASQEIISVTLQGREGVPSDQLFSISPKQVGQLSPRSPAVPVAGRLSVELDSGGSMVFWRQASDLIPEQRCAGVSVPQPRPSQATRSSDISRGALWGTGPTAQLINTTEIPHYFRLLVSRPFSVSQDGVSRSHRAPSPSWKQECKEGTAAAGKQLVLYPQENMLGRTPITRTTSGKPLRTGALHAQECPDLSVNVSFSLSLELLSYQKLPADQMLPGVDIQQSASGEKQMVFTQNLLLEYSNQTTQLSTSWVDFGTCFVNQGRVREVYLMNLSSSRSYWTQEPDKDPVAFRVSPSSGLLEARPVNAPPTSVPLQVSFTARSCELYESTLVVEGVLGEKSCTLRLQGRGSYDERYASPY